MAKLKQSSDVEELRITNVSVGLKRTLEIIAENNGYGSISPFIKQKLRELVNATPEKMKVRVIE